MTSKVLYWIPVLIFNFSVASHAGIVTYTDYNAFLAAAGDVHVIDFETLPDGSPSVVFAEITPEFNYTDQGVDFFSHEPMLSIGGNNMSGFNLIAAQRESGGPRNWIIAELLEPATAIGVLFPGSTTIEILNVSGSFLGDWVWGGSGQFFFGVISDDPIGTVIIDRGIEVEVIESFYFSPIPEPATIILLTVGAVVVVRRRKYSLHDKY